MLDSLRSFCLSLPASTEDIKWENHLTYCIGSKMYVIFGMDDSPINASFKVSEDDFDILCEIPGIKPAPYLAKNKWVSIDNIELFTSKQWEEYLLKSYTIIKSKLTKKLQHEIDGKLNQ